METAPNADALVDLIDDGLLQPQSHMVVRGIFSAVVDRTPDEELMLSAGIGTESCGGDKLLRLLWSKIEDLPEDQQGGLRLLVALLKPNKALDGHEAEYFVNWARERGLSNQEIMHAFGCP